MTSLEELLKDLPPDIQQKAVDVLEFLFAKKGGRPKVCSKPFAKPTQVTSKFEQRGKSKFFEKAQRIAKARADIVQIYCQTLAQTPYGRKCLAQKDFLTSYNLKSFPELYDVLGHVSRPTIERWKKTIVETGDTMKLAPRQGECWRKKRQQLGGIGTTVNEAQAQCLLAAADLHHQCQAKVVRYGRRLMRERGVPDTLSEDSYLRFLKQWQEQQSALVSNR